MFLYFCRMKSDFHAVLSALQADLPTLKGVYLFGSRADGSALPDSDFDLAFLAPGHVLDDYALYCLRLKLAQLLNADVDLIDLNHASTVLQFQIVAKGQRIFSSDSLFCDEFDLFVFSSYQRLNESQQDLLEDIKTRGRIYA